jgi:hypothetical protein
MDTNYTHDDTECFCIHCGNNSQLIKDEMCEYCYDDLSLRYYCYTCNNYYNYQQIINLCPTYIDAINKIKKFLKKHLYSKNN